MCRRGWVQFLFHCTLALGAVLLCVPATASALELEPDVVWSEPLSLSGDLTLNANLVIYSNVALNGHTLTVAGSLYHRGGTLQVGSGTLAVLQDYTLEAADGGQANAYLSMDDPAGRMQVDGSMRFHATYSSSLSAGTLELKGNFTQVAGYRWDNFPAYGSHRTLLSGTGAQEITFEAPGSSYFNVLRITNPTAQAVRFKQEPAAAKLESTLPTLSMQARALAGGVSLAIDRPVEVFPLAGYTDVLLTGQTVSLAQGADPQVTPSLTIHGALAQTGGNLVLGPGSITIEGDYTVEAADGGQANAYLTMENDAGRLLVQGNMRFHTAYPSSLPAGTLELKGNFTQVAGYRSDNFPAYGTHITLLSGTATQEVDFGAPGSSYFNVLRITNPTAQAVRFKQEPAAAVLDSPLATLAIQTRALTGAVDLTITRPVEVFPLAGYTDVLLYGHTLTLAQGADPQITPSLLLHGALAQSGGNLVVGPGAITIEGDYTVEAADGGQANAYLTMESDAGRLLVQGSMRFHTAYPSSLLAGLLELKGSFTQVAGYRWDNFPAYGSHRTLLSGAGAQAISFGAPNASRFNILEIANPLPGAVSFAQDVTAMTLRSDLPELVVRAREITRYTDLTLTGNLTVLPFADGDPVVVGGATLRLQRYRLAVRSSLIQSGGAIAVEVGVLDIQDDYRIQAPDGAGGWTASNSDLQMTHPAGLVLVGRHFTTHQLYRSGSLIAGALEVRGDFTQITGYHWDNFAAEGTRVRLTGTGPQTVSFGTPGQSHFDLLEILNPIPGAVTFTGGVPARALASPLPTLVIQAPQLTGNIDLRLLTNLTVRPVTAGSPVYMYGSQLDLNGFRLTVETGLIQAGGTVLVHAGVLDVRGDYRLQSPEGAGYTVADAYLQMAAPSDLVRVTGSFTTQPRYNGTTLSAGTLEVHGDFTQLAGYHWDNFAPTGGHKVRLAGSGPQTVSFNTPGASQFAALEVANCVGPVQFGNPSAVWTTRVDSCGQSPAISASSPADGSAGVQPARSVVVVFSAGAVPGTAFDAITLTDAQGQPVPATRTLQGGWLLLRPSGRLAPGATYTVTIPASAVTIPGAGPLAQTQSFGFTTATGPDLLPLRLVAGQLPDAGPLDYAATRSGLALAAGGQLRLIAAGGARSSLVSLPGGARLVAIRESACPGGFTTGEIFLTLDPAGTIWRLPASGSTLEAWATFPAEYGAVTALTQDRTCFSGGDLFAATDTGKLLQIKAGGLVTLLADLATPLRGLVSVPNDSARYGPLAGTLLVSAPALYQVIGVAADGTVAHRETSWATELAVIPAGEHLYASDPHAGVYMAPASALAPWAGDLLVAQERPGALQRMVWDGTAFQFIAAGELPWVTGMAFAPVSIEPPAGTVTITGMVRAQGRISHANILITLVAEVGPPIQTVSGTTGSFQVMSVPDGTYTLTASRGAHRSAGIQVAVYGGLVLQPTGEIDLGVLPFGDIDGDGDVDLSDIGQFMLWYGESAASFPGNLTFDSLDVNADGRIDLYDLAILTRNVQ